MSKVLAGLFALILVLGCVSNQNTFVYGAEFGIKIGTQRLESDSESFRPRMGLFYSIDLGKNFKLQPEVYLSYFTYDYAGINFTGTESARKEVRYYDNLRYLEVPILIKYRMPLKGDLKPVLLVGGYAAIRLSERTPDHEVSMESLDWWEFYETPLIRDYAGIEGGVVLGLGLEHGSGKTRLSFDVRFNIGLTNMARVSSSYTLRDSFGIDFLPYDYTQRNHSMSFSVGLSF